MFSNATHTESLESFWAIFRSFVGVAQLKVVKVVTFPVGLFWLLNHKKYLDNSSGSRFLFQHPEQ